MKKLRVAQIGTGHDHASGIFTALREMTDEVEILGYWTPDDDRDAFTNDRWSEYGDLPRIGPEEIFKPGAVDAVTVETEDLRLTKYAAMALEAGIPVHMDKPGAPDQASFAAMCDLASKKDLPLSLGYMYRFNPAIRELLEALEKGALGSVLHVNAEMSCRHRPWKRAWLEDYPGGMMYFLGCHLVDLIYRLQGEPLEVVAMNAATGMDGVDAVDQGFAVFRYAKGASFARASAAERGGYARRNVVIACEEGTFELLPTERISVPGGNADLLKTDYHLTTDTAWRASGEWKTTPEYHRYKPMLRAFLERVRGEREETVFTPDYEKRLHALLLRACGQ
ncbi:MAG: Gfo/Idh/MocA family oxidoreductase [Clostridia bacterium]|nr:Gfo/Idh/MocA family oxidoreductase [Clostridia bacterium]